ncbi:cellulose biosynthesis protein BcsQ [Melaminivora alkalimesophila]|uniref:Cellulose synthase operon protein YhjQ n=1 Tax=Melaminivora alkalimesophila TaxID=1165852 RepID=A0A317RC34_9BURK|nr:cellulose biosynthesis protein BcsQ [Melaminivora alkalimesophila]PWW46799.1 cellulose synthase operon protein YhjQ [Melaminivora alkalimesophila]
MNVLAVASAKGGVGKTTVTASLAAALSRLTQRTVLAIDLDPQNALAFHMGCDPLDLRGLSRASLAGQGWGEACFELQPGQYVLPYGAVTEQDRTTLEARMAADPDWLAHHLRALQLPDDALVLLDTPPGPSVYGQQALSVARWVLVVMLADAASYATLPLMQRMIQTYCAPRPDFAEALYLLNQLNSARALSQDVLQVLRDAVGPAYLGAILERRAGDARTHS